MSSPSVRKPFSNGTISYTALKLQSLPQLFFPFLFFNKVTILNDFSNLHRSVQDGAHYAEITVITTLNNIARSTAMIKFSTK